MFDFVYFCNQCYPNVARILVKDPLTATAGVSTEGEQLSLREPFLIPSDRSVDIWLKELESLLQNAHWFNVKRSVQ